MTQRVLSAPPPPGRDFADRSRPWRLRGVRRAVVALAGAAVLTAIALVVAPGVGPVAVVAVPIAVATPARRGLGAIARRRRRRRPAAQTGRPARRSATPLGISIVEIAAVLATAIAGVSWGQAMRQPSNSSFGIRTVEWLRDQGGAGLVSGVERAYYSLTAPAKGGAQLRTLPAVGVPAAPGSSAMSGPARTRAPSAARRAHHPRPSFRPPRVQPLLRPALRGEGVWTVTQGRFVRASRPPVLVAAYRPERDYPRLVAGLAWFDHRRTSVSLYAGTREPPGGADTSGAQVPVGARRRLLATFNSGFKHRDSGGGFFAHGRLIDPLVAGQGTIVGMQDGRVDVRAWHGGPRPRAGVAFARQNLPLIVDQRRANPNLSDGPQWGATLGNAILVWRSGVGVDAHGNLLYAAGPDLGVAGLARILIHAGAVRAVELDINSYWVTLNTYGLPGAGAARPLLPAMHRSAQRYLTPDDRDFFAVYVR
jgi:hypothetical protein